MTTPKTTWVFPEPDTYRLTPEGYESAHPNFTAKLAMQLAGNLSIILAAPDGEDSAGRQKLKLMEPQAVASHACAIAEEMTKLFDARGWFTECPLPRIEKREPRKPKEGPGHPT